MRAYDVDIEQATGDYHLYVASSAPEGKQIEIVDDPASWARKYALGLLVLVREYRDRNAMLERRIAALSARVTREANPE